MNEIDIVYASHKIEVAYFIEKILHFYEERILFIKSLSKNKIEITFQL